MKSYSGYVHLPPGTLSDVGESQNYPINTFFWFFESRKDPTNAPLSIWINGGPGSSSMIGLLNENGPCNVNVDSNSTTLNPWSFNNEVNMLYIDQPNQVGFSWDVLTNGTINQATGDLTPTDFSGEVPRTNDTFNVGTFPSQDPGSTANDTRSAARALWHFAQTWFQEFPDYKPNNNGISIFAESYGGHYGSAVSTFFEEQNAKIANQSINATGDTYIIHLDTLGIVNGCIDSIAQEPSYAEMAYNNTYGIQAINQTNYQAAIDAFNRPKTGCRDLILNCRALAADGDPNFTGANATVNAACSDADSFCSTEVEGAYVQTSGRDYYDIAALKPSSFPPSYYLGYLANAHVQAALGVPVNYTDSSTSVYSAFQGTGDFPRANSAGGYLGDIGALLDSGVKVALMYGDRDWICNWIGGEAASLAVNYSQSPAFASAGYANISVNSTYVGGQVRQHGNFSFSRVFQAGHEVPAYQPETAYRIFQRAIFGNDIATGTLSASNNASYSTVGSSTTFEVKNRDLGSPSPQCYVLALATTCTDEQMRNVIAGIGLVHDYILIDANQSHLFPGTGPADTGGGKRSTASVVGTSWGMLGGVTAVVLIGWVVDLLW